MYRALVVLTTAVAGSIITSTSEQLKVKKTFEPPSYIFIIVWLVIYITYAIIWEYLAPILPQWLDNLFCINMILNFLWVFVYFGLGQVLLSQIIILLLLFVTFIQILSLMFINKIKTIQKRQWIATCELALLFYLSWLVIATFLNFN